MKVYKVIKGTHVSYRSSESVVGPNKMITCRATEFNLNVGDYVFIKEGIWVKMVSRIDYKKHIVLDKIYYSETIYGKNLVKIDTRMTWIENIGVLEPKFLIKPSIYNMVRVDIDEAIGDCLEDVTLNWEREQKLKRIV